MGKEKRKQSYWNLPRGSQLATAGPSVMQPGFHSYRMGMIDLFFLFSVCCPFKHLFPPPVYTSLLFAIAFSGVSFFMSITSAHEASLVRNLIKSSVVLFVILLSVSDTCCF